MRKTLPTLSALVALAVATPAFAQFSPGPSPVTGTVGAQTLSGGTGTVNGGGAISIASGSTVALTMTGTSTLLNNGTIQTLGTGRAIDSNSGIANLTVTNNGLISAVSTDAFRVNTNSAVSLTNNGTIRVTAGGQAIDWAAITSAGNTLTNNIGALISSVGEDAVRPGTNGIVINAGTIQATPTVSGGAASGSDGIDVRTFTGIQVTNTGTIRGRHGIATDGANVGPSTITVTNNAGGLVEALNGSGLNIDGVSASVTANVVNQAGATFRGGVLATTTNGDGDGIDVDGVLTLNNSGDVLGLGAKGVGSDTFNNNAEAIAAGGGTITNNAGGRIVGSTLLADAPNGDVSRAGNGILIDNSGGGNAVAATTVTNGGLIQGVTGFGIRMIGSFADTVTNLAGGIIRGATSAGSGAAIQLGDGNDTLTNRGAIISDVGNAIDLEAGNDQLVIEGGVASIAGNVSGGAGTDTATLNPGTGNAFAYAGVLSAFETVDVQSGTVTLSGSNTYSGTTIVNGGTLVLDGANRLASSSSLDLSGGTLQLANAGGANGQTFASLVLSDTSTLDLGLSSLSFGGLGAVGSGETLSVLSYDGGTSPSFALRFFGDLSGSASFLALVGATTINGLAATFSFDGTYTNVAPVPLPAAAWLLLSGLGLFGGVARRRVVAKAVVSGRAVPA
jgi:autotransporter-associated beta strand protein